MTPHYFPRRLLVKRLLFGFAALASFSIPACTPSAPNPVVKIETSMGDIKVELYQDKAPITVKNFLRYVDEKHYDGTIFHRVIADFMIQGGGFEPGLESEKSTHPAIENESSNGLSNERGTIAMARTNAPNSATAQFFINVKNNPPLDRANARDKVGYAVFGKVIDGMGVVDKIRDVPTHSVGPHDDVPVEDVVIKSIRRVEVEKKDNK
jgi:cyclophilin family peptidyl-prolyl cis-trans isomerase